jgi:hypothetical protein
MSTGRLRRLLPRSTPYLRRSAALLLAKGLQSLVQDSMDVLGDKLALHACVLHLVGVHEKNRLAVYFLDLRDTEFSGCGIQCFSPSTRSPLGTAGNFLA